jgi:gamma-glutamyl:cysteine ligase YbdK (ATP-grasp superfamily)
MRRKKIGTTDHIFTLGIEEEFQIIDPETRELCSQSQRNYGPV